MGAKFNYYLYNTVQILLDKLARSEHRHRFLHTCTSWSSLNYILIVFFSEKTNIWDPKKKLSNKSYFTSLTEYYFYFSPYRRWRHAFSYSKHLPYKVVLKFDNLVYITFVELFHVRCAISEHKDTNVKTTDWKFAILKVKLTKRKQ